MMLYIHQGVIKKERKDNHIGGALESRVFAITSHELDGTDNLNGDQLHTIGRRILFLPTINHSNNTKISILFELFK